jgi:carbamoyl-phosphate synthase small subunit
MNGYLTTEEGATAEDALAKAKAWPGLVGVDYVKEVTHQSSFAWDEEDTLSPEFRLPKGPSEIDGRTQRDPMPTADVPIVAYDFGIKYNILRRLRQTGFAVTLVPANTPADEVLKHTPAGIFLSNGPGDPAAVTYAMEAVAALLAKGLPIFGICLGHQILGLAMGGKTSKLKFGHRGANQPVKDLESGRVEITSQNHGFTVETDSLPGDVKVNRVNLNDQTVEGLRHKTKPVFCVQYHPEASPGPHDSSGLFGEFRQLVEKHG